MVTYYHFCMVILDYTKSYRHVASGHGKKPRLLPLAPRRATQGWRRANLYLSLFDDGRDFFPHHPPHVEEIPSHGAGHDVPHESGRVVPQHPDHLGPKLTPV